MLINYLPDFIGNVVQMQGIADVEQPEIDALDAEIEYVLCQMFVESADEYGIGRFEGVLNIEGNDSEDLDFRKFRVLASLNESRRKNLEQLLENILGEDGYKIYFDVDSSYLEIKINVQNKDYLDIVKKMMDRVVPCNIILDVSILYASHQMTSAYTHEFLSKFSHDEIKLIGIEL